MMSVFLQQSRDLLAREVAITGLFEDIANALARVARALGVPVLASLGQTRDIAHSWNAYPLRAPSRAKHLQGMTRPEGSFEAGANYVFAGVQPIERARRRAAAAGAQASARHD